MKNYTVVFDVDDTIAEFMKSALEVVKRETGLELDKNTLRRTWLSSLPPDQYKKVEGIISTVEFYLGLELRCPLLPELTRQLRSDVEIHMVTARESLLGDAAQSTTYLWLEKHGFRYDKVTTCKINQDKTDLYPRNTRCVVEDAVYAAEDAAKMGIEVALIDQPWNQGVSHNLIYRVRNTDELRKVIEGCL